jgi:hypothetical protein
MLKMNYEIRLIVFAIKHKQLIDLFRFYKFRIARFFNPIRFLGVEIEGGWNN